jgi:anaerobic selenocysteine-containing dehydrogenase
MSATPISAHQPSSVRETHAAICGVCPGGCAVETDLENGKLVAVRRRAGVPFGAICLRGKHAAEVVHSPDRLTTPLIRVGERGEGRFRVATWEEALDLVAARVKEIGKAYGPQAVASHSGRGAFEQSLLDFNSGELVASTLLLPFGSPNTSSVASLCYVSFGVLAPMTTYGLLGSQLAPDIENSNLIVAWGANPATDSPPYLFDRILAAKRKGTRILAIDHMRSDIARRADQWIQIRPGTDGALALGLLHVVILEKLYDREFVEKWTHGFAELESYVKDFTPGRVESITRVPAQAVTNLARELVSAKHATLRTYTGLEYSNSGVQTIRAVFILWALTGNLDVPGGLNINPLPPSTMERAPVERPKGVAAIGSKEYPLFHQLTGLAQFIEFPKAVLQADPYPVKALLNFGASILTSYPQPEIWEKAFRALELLVVTDRFLTKDALFADVVLPSTTYFEIDSYQRYPGYVRLRKKVVEPVGESRNDILILRGLAERLGYGDLLPKDEEDAVTKAFARKPELLEALKASSDGVALQPPPRQYRKFETGQLRPDGKPGFNTPSGKLEIASSLLREHGYPPLPEYVEPIEGPLANPELFRKYPLVLSTGARIQTTFRSQHLNIPGLLKSHPLPEALIHPEDAFQRKIVEGAKVLVTTPRGKVEFYAKVTDQVPKGVVEINVGGGAPMQAPAWQKANANFLTDINNRDPISGFPVFKALLCQVTQSES